MGSRFLSFPNEISIFRLFLLHKWSLDAWRRILRVPLVASKCPQDPKFWEWQNHGQYGKLPVKAAEIFIYPEVPRLRASGPVDFQSPFEIAGEKDMGICLGLGRGEVPLDLEPLRFPATSKGPSRRAHGLWRPHWLWWMRGPVIQCMSNVFGVINKMIILDISR